MREAQGAAGLGEGGLVGHPGELLGRLVGQEVSVRQFGTVLGQGEGAEVVEGNEERGGGVPGREPQQEVGEGGGESGGGGGRGAGVDGADVAGAGGGARGRLQYRVDRDAHPAQGAGGAQGAVMKGVPVEPHENGGDAGVKSRHGFPSSRCPKWAMKYTNGLLIRSEPRSRSAY
ncbi:hypothetical protein [Streptomyces sp. NPDC048350]|uniref:hypothetical protein n=1 Tax=Streptomyces sp. NPDC048350 TaxID=3365538 RepID=UPI003717B388